MGQARHTLLLLLMMMRQGLHMDLSLVMMQAVHGAASCQQQQQ